MYLPVSNPKAPSRGLTSGYLKQPNTGMPSSLTPSGAPRSARLCTGRRSTRSASGPARKPPVWLGVVIMLAVWTGIGYFVALARSW